MQEPIPIVLDPPGILNRITGSPEKYFPDDGASRWMLYLLTASHDIGVSLRLWTPYLHAQRFNKRRIKRQRYLYRMSHVLYFMRLIIAHSWEAWEALERHRSMQDPVIDRIWKNPNIVEERRQLLQLLAQSFGGIPLARIIKRFRAMAFHYRDREGDNWALRIGTIEHGTPLGIIPDSGRAAECRWWIADEFLYSRLNHWTKFDESLQTAVRDFAFGINYTINASIEPAYFAAREGRDWDPIKEED